MHRWLENKFSASHLSWCPQHLLVQEQGDGSIKVLISLAVLGRKPTALSKCRKKVGLSV